MCVSILISISDSPSEPNYIAALSGDFWGLGDDNVRVLRVDMSPWLAHLISVEIATLCPVLPYSYKHHDGHRSPRGEEDLMGYVPREHAPHRLVDRLHST